MKFSNSKIIVTPNAIHVTEYSENYAYDFRIKKKRNRTSKSRPRDDLRNAFRAKKQVRLILEANSLPETFVPGSSYRPLFVTLTFSENITDIKGANKEFTKFIKRLNYALTQQEFGNSLTLKYLVVPEFQKRGAVHYHVIFFKFPIQKDTNKFLSEIWGHGFTFNNTITSVNHLKNYVTKYFTKNLQDERLKGKKHYFCSKNLFRPRVFNDKNNNRNIIDTLPSPNFTTSYEKNGKKTTYSIYENPPITRLLYILNKEKPKIILEPRQLKLL